jgi:TonB family protein
MMASPSNLPSWLGLTEPVSFVGPTAVPEQHENIVDADLILSRLREQIARGRQDVDALLGAIAIAAQVMTDATGAALGMRRDGSVVCVGRSGETAPALGARLSESSGISGECLRNGRNQRCDDSETDASVDAEVCRSLGLRSIAAVPIRSRLETVGVLEVFSTSANAFTDEHMARISSLAELADAASAPASHDGESTVIPHVELIPRPDLPILTSPWSHYEKRRKPIWRYFAAAGTVILIGLFSFACWRMWHELRSRNEPELSQVARSHAPIQSATELPLPDQTSLPAKPLPEEIRPASAKAAPKNQVVQAAALEPEPDYGLIRSIPVDGADPANTQASTSDNPIEKSAPTNTAPPQVTMVSTPDSSLNEILAGETPLPALGSTSPEGVTQPVLAHKVMPEYPRGARMLRMEGSVLIHATVTDQGRVSNMKVVSGNPVLAKAAMDAVRRWRYHPAQMNGKPTPIETDITLNFKLP